MTKIQGQAYGRGIQRANEALGMLWQAHRSFTCAHAPTEAQHINKLAIALDRYLLRVADRDASQ